MRDNIKCENMPTVTGDTVPSHHGNPRVGITPDITRLTRALNIAAHPVRLKMLLAIGGDEVSVQDIATNIGIEANTVSKHLALLSNNGVVASRKDARRIYYRVTDAVIQKVIGLMCDMVLQSPTAKDRKFTRVMSARALPEADITR